MFNPTNVRSSENMGGAMGSYRPVQLCHSGAVSRRHAPCSQRQDSEEEGPQVVAVFV